MTPQGGTCTGAAWLSSARAVRCWVKSRNERNPCVQLPARKGGDSGQTAGVKPEEGGDDVKSSWPLCLGLHTYYNGPDKATQDREVEQIAKTVPQFRLYSAIRVHEVGIASNRGSALPRWMCSWALYTPPVKPPKGGASEVVGAERQTPKMKLLMGTKS